MDVEAKVAELNRMLSGWANYFALGQVSPAYQAIDRHTNRRLRRWLCLKHKVRSGTVRALPGRQIAGRPRSGTLLAPKTKAFPWAKA